MNELQTIQTNTISFVQAKAAKEQIIWEKLDSITVQQALNFWFDGLSHRTLKLKNLFEFF